jgi:Flp pilus assembly protein TadG
MSGQKLVIRRTSATWHAIRTFLIGTDGMAGNALIEFAIIAPLLIVMCVYVADFGFFLFRQTELQHATQTGAQYAIAYGYDSAKISSAVSNDSNDASFTISTTPNEFCACPESGVVTQIASGACVSGSTCPGGAVAGTYVTVSTTATYNTIAPVSGKLFTITVPSSYLLKGSATVRIQ